MILKWNNKSDGEDGGEQTLFSEQSCTEASVDTCSASWTAVRSAS